MTDTNQPLEEWDDDKIDSAITAMHDAQLLCSGLRFMYNCTLGVYATVPEMVAKRQPVGFAEFDTNGGRRAMVVVVVGDEDVKDMKEFILGETHNE